MEFGFLKELGDLDKRKKGRSQKRYKRRDQKGKKKRNIWLVGGNWKTRKGRIYLGNESYVLLYEFVKLLVSIGKNIF